MSPPGKSTTNLQENFFPSNFFIKCLFRDENFKKHIKQIEENKLSNKFESINSIIDVQLSEIIKEIIGGFRNEDDDKDEAMCCRNVNYYFDLLYAIIKSPGQVSNDNTNNLISQILQKWNNVPKVNDKDKCKRETDIDSICKRSILKHLHDLKLDKMIIKTSLDEYNNYLYKQWEKIIAYISRYYDNLYIKIENDFMGIIEPYSHFLQSSDFICDTELDAISIDDITISTNWDNLMNSVSLEKFTSKGIDKGCYNKNYIEILKIKASNIQRINNILSSGIAIFGFILILVLIRRFTPLRSSLRGCTKKKVEIDENMSEEEMSELYDDSENERTFISYHSVSH
ncbi:PIR Superfamily Protein [Plasmodium ovale wallikeri]|uniref:PIR Superfamily Protein n=1 Tax=Plasmodium ovale wallikeri TaxID=864142 RepID=A0A1A9AGE0_PLAOA|nr:PIR Superfamily Protein [Plasmodium ovale wallikeri]